MRDSFIFYRSFYEALKDLSIKDRAILFEAICEFSLNGNEIELQKVPKTVFKLIQPILNANNKKFESGLKGAEFGKLGGRPKKIETPSKPQQNPIETPNKDKDKDINKESNLYILGDHSDEKYILVTPPDINSPKYRINGISGFKQYFEMNKSIAILRNESQISQFMLSKPGAHYDDFRHVYNAFNKFRENNTGQAYGR